MTQALTGAPNTTEPGAIVFLPEDQPWSEEDVYDFLSGGATALQAAGLIAAADTHAGAMIAFIPSSDDLAELVLDEEGAEPLDELHITAIYLGDVATLDEPTRMAIISAITDIAERQSVINAEVFGYSVWNPDEDACLVADVGGDELADAFDTVLAELEGVDMELPEQHEPWRPHVTLTYANDPRRFMTDELMGRTGPIVIDRIRVAFGGIITDFPLGAVTASAQAFHYGGGHNQQSHGRGGATPGELAAGERMSRGKMLDESDPEQARLAGAVRSWTHGGQEGANLNADIQRSLDDPTLDTPGASFTRMVAGAPAGSPELHRGMGDVPDHMIPEDGAVFDLGPTSFSRSRSETDQFTRPRDSEFGPGTIVRIRVAKGSRSVPVDHYASKKFKGEKEHVALGRYQVTGRRESRTSTLALDGKKRDVKIVELDVIQVEDGRPVTFHGGRPRIIEQGDEGF